MICCRTDEEIKKEIFDLDQLAPHLTACEDSSQVRFKRWIEKGALFDAEDWYA